MKKFLIVLAACCLILALLVVLIAVVIAAYFYFAKPDFSSLQIPSLNTPKDLGVTYTQADLQKGREITNIQFQDLPANNTASIEFSGSKDISGTYTSEMITAMIDNATYINYPLTNTQVKINPDGTIETAGNIDINKLINWAIDLNADTATTSEIENYTSTIISNPSFYLKGTMSVTNNQINLNISQAQISILPINQQTINEYQGQVADFVEERIANVPGMNIRSADFSTGKLILDGTYPAIEKTIKK